MASEKTEKVPKTSKDSPGNKILVKIKNTMSDRASTEVAFNELLKSYRAEIIPSVIDGWRDMDFESQEAVTRMNNFFCGLHLLVGFAETAEKVITKFENANLEKPVGAAADPHTKLFSKSSESGTVRTVRTAAKLLARGADEKSGCYRPFKDFLHGIHKKERLEKFLGNRFNILFYDAEVLYFLQEDIIHFLKDIHGTTNLLSQGVLLDVQEDIHVAGCKALGLCSKMIMSPLWRIIESKGNVFEMNDHYMHLLSFFEECSKDPSDFVAGKWCPFPDMVVGDKVYDKLASINDKTDTLVHNLITVLFTAWQTYLTKSVKDYLPEGKYNIPSETVTEEARSAAKHNKFPEQMFGLMDSLIRNRPNASDICNEAFILFTNNKTMVWLESKTHQEKAALLKSAHKFGSDMREVYKSRSKEIAEERIRALREKQKKQEEAVMKKLREKENLTDDIIYYGLWQSKYEVTSKLSEIKTKTEQEKAIKIQLKFRQSVLQQSYDDLSIYNFSKNKKKLTVPELQNNLEKLIEDAYKVQPETSESQRSSVPLLTGKNVKHYFVEDNKSEKVSYKGKVISTVPGFPEWYNIVYDDDDSIYTYKLLDDYARGDLEVLVH